jgi:hypothetical protein
MKKAKTPQSKAHDVIRLNRLLGLIGSMAITQTKINKYRDKFQNNGKLIETILNSLFLPMGSSLSDVCTHVAKKSGHSESEVAKFYLHVVESVILGEKRVGKQLSLEPLVAFAKKNGSILNSTPVVEEETKRKSKFNKGEYDSGGKRTVWKKIISLLRNPNSPKSGEVLTLSNLFQFEKVLIDIPSLKYVYTPIEYVWSIYKQQMEMWEHSYKLRRHINCCLLYTSDAADEFHKG